MIPLLFFSILLPTSSAEITASALAYKAVRDALKNKPRDLMRKFTNTNGPLDLTQPLLLFPCRVE